MKISEKAYIGVQSLRKLVLIVQVYFFLGPKGTEKKITKDGQKDKQKMAQI